MAQAVSRSWTFGTDLRDKDIYSWTLPSGRTLRYNSVTSILKPHFAAGFAHVQPWAIAKRVSELLNLEEQNKPVLHFTGWGFDDEKAVKLFEERHPREVLKDTKYLRYEGDRYLERAAHRGSSVHALLPLWEQGKRYTDADIKYVIPDLIAERCYLCEEDEAVGYALALNRFLHERNPIVRLTEMPVFHDRLLVAGTEDGFWSFDGGKTYDLIDVKTSKAVRPGFAEQLATYYFAEKIGKPVPHETASGRRRKMPRANGAMILLVQPDKVVPRRLKDLCAAWESAKHCIALYRANGNGSLFKTERGLVWKTSNDIEIED